MKKSLIGKVVGVSWQDIWWSADERQVDMPYEDENYIHFTYGLVIREDKHWLSVSHEFRPARTRHMGTTSIPKKVIRSVKVYGDGDIEASGKKRHRHRSASSRGRQDAQRSDERSEDGD